jgi:hypothetical protein
MQRALGFSGLFATRGMAELLARSHVRGRRSGLLTGVQAFFGVCGLHY